MSFIHNTQKTGTIFFSHEYAPTQPTFPTFLITPDKIVIIINRVRHEHSIPADLINKKFSFGYVIKALVGPIQFLKCQ